MDATFLYKIENIIKEKFAKQSNILSSYDILDDDNDIDFIKSKIFKMKIGEIWQEIIGEYIGYTNLKVGHSSGLDIISYNKKIIIELKNRTNTDNSSSRKTNLTKLSNYKKLFPDFKCIYACVNEKTEEKTTRGTHKMIIHDDSEIEYMTGMKFLNFIFGEHTNVVIYNIKMLVKKYKFSL